MKNSGESYDGQESNKQGRVGKAAAGKAASLPVKKMSNSSQNLPVSIKHNDDLKIQNQLVSCSKKNIADVKPVSNPAVSLNLNVSSDDTPPIVIEAKDIDKQNVGNLQSRNASDKCKDASGSFDGFQKKSSHAHSKSQPGRPSSSSDGVGNIVQSKEKNGICELPDLNLTAARATMQATVSFFLLLFSDFGKFFLKSYSPTDNPKQALNIKFVILVAVPHLFKCFAEIVIHTQERRS